MILSRVVKVQGEDRPLRYRCAHTCGEFLRWTIALAHSDQTILHVQEYLADYMVMGSLEGVTSADLLKIGEDVATLKALPEEFLADSRKWWRIIFGGEDYEPEEGTYPCECPACKKREGMELQPPTDKCLFYGIDPRVQMMASYDWELASQCWDMPIEVWQMRMIRNQEYTMGTAAKMQERERKNKEDREMRKANSPSSWAQVNAARAKALDKQGG